MKHIVTALLLVALLGGCGEDDTCPPPPDGGYQPGDKIVDCKGGFIKRDAQ